MSDKQLLGGEDIMHTQQQQQQQQQQKLPHDVGAYRQEVETATNERIQEGQEIEEGDETMTTKECIQNQQLRQLEHNISPPTSSKEFHENELVSSTIWKESEYDNNQEHNDQRSRQTITKVTTKQRSEETNVNDDNYCNYDSNCQTVMIDDDANGNVDDYSSFVAVELDLPLENVEMTTISPMTTTTTTTTAKKIICQSTHLTTTTTLAPTTTPDDETIYDNSLLLFDMNANEVERGEEEEEELVLTSNVPPPPRRQMLLHHPLLSVMKNVPWDKLLMVSTGTCDLFFNCKYSARQVEDEVRAEEEQEEKGSSYIHDEWEEEEGSDGCQQQQHQQREKDGYVPISLGHEYNELDQECHHHHHGDNHYEREEGECFNNIHTEEFENLGLDYNSSMLDDDDDDDEVNEDDDEEVNEDDDGGCRDVIYIHGPDNVICMFEQDQVVVVKEEEGQWE
jgi:hypothetical protein